MQRIRHPRDDWFTADGDARRPRQHEYAEQGTVYHWDESGSFSAERPVRPEPVAVR